MKIYRAVQSNIKYQGFGENAACAKIDDFGKVVRPFQIIGKSNAVCPVGYGEFYKLIGMKGHPGEDWSAYHGEQGYFPVVVEGMKWWGRAEIDEGKGLNLYVFSLEPIAFDELPPQTSEHARNLWLSQGKKIHICFVYSHLLETILDDKPKIQIGILGGGVPQMAPEIKVGDLIFRTDNTGASSADHLHRSMKFRFQNSMVAGADNGYVGAVDDSEWYENRFILELAKPTFSFKKVLKRGMFDTDVGVMQSLLVQLGFMQPFKESEVGNFGAKTQEGVYKFQLKYVDLSWYERKVLKGALVGAKTMLALNKLVT